MINTGLDSYKAVQEMGSRIKKEVNTSNAREGEKSTLEIEVDGIFKTMLLCKKKKYAAVRSGGSDGNQISVEKKGLDLVRRDWCELSHEMGE
jgi:DNA polymerase alpha subunit A